MSRESILAKEPSADVHALVPPGIELPRPCRLLDPVGRERRIHAGVGQHQIPDGKRREDDERRATLASLRGRDPQQKRRARQLQEERRQQRARAENQILRTLQWKRHVHTDCEAVCEVQRDCRGRQQPRDERVGDDAQRARRGQNPHQRPSRNVAIDQPLDREAGEHRQAERAQRQIFHRKAERSEWAESVSPERDRRACRDRTSRASSRRARSSRTPCAAGPRTRRQPAASAIGTPTYIE